MKEKCYHRYKLLHTNNKEGCGIARNIAIGIQDFEANEEVRRMFRRMVLDWFQTPDMAYNDFVKALLADDKKQ